MSRPQHGVKPCSEKCACCGRRALLTQIEGFKQYPRNSTYIPALRETVNERIKAHL